MKTILRNITLGLGACCLLGCSDLLDTENLYQKNFDNFYSNKKDIDEAISGIYNALFVNQAECEELLVSGALSDLVLGGGGPDDVGTKSIDAFRKPTEDYFKEIWVQTYNGVYRANAVIERIDNVDLSKDFSDLEAAANFKKQSLGEAYFMRGFLMYKAAKFFGGMPLIPSTLADRAVDRASIPETYKFIASDMMKAIANMPTTNITDIPTSEYGHANVWAAKSMLARIFMFYTGYMTNIQGEATTTLPYDGGEITKADIIKHLEDVMNNSGHELVGDFRNLWPYSGVNQSAEKYDEAYDPANPPLPWAAAEGLEWAGQDGHTSPNGWTGNKEAIFVQRFGLGDWGWDNGTGQKYNNRACLYMGIRDHSMVPYAQGWGWCTVHSKFFYDWDDADLRKLGSVIEMNKPEQGTDSWQTGKGAQETSLMNKKYTSLQHNGPDGIKGMFYYIYKMSHGDPMQLWSAQDLYFMRYADVLLMHSELTETATGLNAVRKRAGYTTDISYSLDAIKKERMYEFAFEGIRWFDLLRWGDVNNPANNYYDDVIQVGNTGVMENYSITYRPEVKGLIAIPESEIRLSGNLYKQNPGW